MADPSETAWISSRLDGKQFGHNQTQPNPPTTSIQPTQTLAYSHVPNFSETLQVHLKSQNLKFELEQKQTMLLNIPPQKYVEKKGRNPAVGFQTPATSCMAPPISAAARLPGSQSATCERRQTPAVEVTDWGSIEVTM
jgi:hypothetical protein